jgi:hypothetical protein
VGLSGIPYRFQIAVQFVQSEGKQMQIMRFLSSKSRRKSTGNPVSNTEVKSDVRRLTRKIVSDAGVKSDVRRLTR